MKKDIKLMGFISCCVLAVLISFDMSFNDVDANTDLFSALIFNTPYVVKTMCIIALCAYLYVRIGLWLVRSFQSDLCED